MGTCCLIGVYAAQNLSLALFWSYKDQMGIDLKQTTMKQLLSTAIAGLMAVAMVSCGNNQQKSAAQAELELQRYKDSIRQAADTAGLAEFRTWKAQNELMNEQQAQEEEYAPAAVAPVRSSATRSSSATSRKSSGSSVRRTSSANGGTYSSTSSNTAKKKEGWSKAAKGAAIGGAGGAITGAVINKKNRAAGAVVGGVVGGVVGYGVGRSKDKKDGRY
jgi:hypothetical protein